MHVAVAGTALLSAPMLQRTAAEEHNRLTLWLNEDCCLARESAAGYRHALQGFADPRTIIVPAISTLTWRTAAALRAKAEAGHHVILESAFTFADGDVAERQCRTVSDMFGLPVQLNRERTENATSYLQYRWPVEALVRSFGEPVYIRAGDQHPIAHHFGNRIVAARRSIGRGEMTFLGSPLGPLLFAEDREATFLIRRMIAEPV
jgi:hypothetical protein